jgi:TonB family protein
VNDHKIPCKGPDDGRTTLPNADRAAGPDLAPAHTRPANLLVAGMVVAVHVLLLKSFGHSRSAPLWHMSVPQEPVAWAQITDLSSYSGGVTAPPIDFKQIPIEWPNERVALSGGVDDEGLKDHESPMSAPRLAPVQSVDVSDVARCAGVAADRPLIVILSVQVDTRGSAMAVDVARSSGVGAADQAAIEYARLLRWIPGVVNGAPRAMRVILEAPASS